MKRIFKILFLISIVFIISLTTGCEEKKEETKQEEIQEEVRNADADKVKVIDAVAIEGNKLVILIKNKDEVMARGINITVEYWKKDAIDNGGELIDKLVATSEESLLFLPSSSTASILTYAPTKEYDYYKIFIDIKETNINKTRIEAFEDVIIEDNTEKTVEELKENYEENSLNITIKNKGEKPIRFLEIGVVYYLDGKIVGCVTDEKSKLESMTKDTLKIDLPSGKRKKDHINFDSYRIYLNQAYRVKE